MSLITENAVCPALEVQGIGKRFGGFWAVKDIDLVIKQGERRAILGPNGAGKTSLFNVLTGDLSASSGQVRMHGEDISRYPMDKRIRRGLRRTYQHAHLFDGLSVRDTLFLAVAALRGGWRQVWPVSQRDARVQQAEALAELAGLSDAIHRGVAELSHGQRRQLEIGIALAGEPRVLLLDEPAAGLSPAERPKLRELLTSLPNHITVVLIEHDMNIALQTSDFVTVLYNGEWLADGTPDEIVLDDNVRRVYLGGRDGD